MTIKDESYEEDLNASWEAGMEAAQEASEPEDSEADSESTEEEPADEEGEPAEETEEETTEVESPAGEPEADDEPDVQEDSATEEEPEKPDETDEDKFKQLQRLAKELNYEFDGEKVQNAHFVKLRQQAKVQKEKLEAKAHEKAQQFEQAKAKLEAAYKPYEAMRQAAETGDFDALAKSLGHEDFQGLAMSYANGSTREGGQVLKVRREMEQMRAQQAQLLQKHQAQAQQAQQVQAIEQHKGVIRQTLGQYTQTSDWGDRPELVDMVLQVQQSNAGVTIEQAATYILDAAAQQRDTINTLLGNPQPNAEEVSSSTSTKTTEKKRKTKVIAQSSRADAGEKSDDEDFDHDAWLKRSVALMEKASQ